MESWSYYIGRVMGMRALQRPTAVFTTRMKSREKFCWSLLDTSKGVILGTCARMFNIAGPVLVFGTAASFLYGVIYWAYTMLA